MQGYAKTAVLMSVMTALFMGIGWLLGGTTGAIVALVIAAGMNLFTWWNSDRVVLRTYGAKPASGANGEWLTAMVTELSNRANMPTPSVYIIPSEQPNAFATGRNPENAAVAITTGLLRTSSREEVAAVMAHELAHVKNRDTLIMTVTATFAGAIGMLANFFVFFGNRRDTPLGLVGMLMVMILAPLAATLVQMAISRSREYEADRVGAEICGNPMWLASALRNIDSMARRVDYNAAERNPSTAHMFIVNPLHTQRHDRLFATHPSAANRIAALERLPRSRNPVNIGMAPGERKPSRPRGPWG